MAASTLFQNLGPALRWLRLRQRLSLQKLSAKTGIGRGSLRRFERGGKRPSLEQLDRLMGTFGVSLLELKETMERVDGHEEEVEAMTLHAWRDLPRARPREEPWSELAPLVAALAAGAPARGGRAPAAAKLSPGRLPAPGLPEGSEPEGEGGGRR